MLLSPIVILKRKYMHLKTERSRSDLCPHCHIIMLLGKIKENEKATGILESDE